MTVCQPADRLISLSRDLFIAAGTPADIAHIVAESLVTTNLLGHDSHGVLRIKQYITMIRQGMIRPASRPRIKKRFGATATALGGYGFGQLAARFGAELAIDMGKEHGIAAVSVAETTHIGRLGEYTQMIAAQGLIGIGFTSGTMYRGWVAPYGGRERVFGTNPMSFAVPAEDDSVLLLDFATAAVAHGKVVLAQAKGTPLPRGVLLDKHGRPSTDAAILDDGAVLLAMGLHKGSGLSMMMEIIPTLLAGHRPISSPDFRYGNPTLLIALSPRAFDAEADFRHHVAELKRRVKQVKPAAGFEEALLPGEPEARAYAKRIQAGIPLPNAVWQDLQTLAAEYGLAINWP